jgi:hypothetical protein
MSRENAEETSDAPSTPLNSIRRGSSMMIEGYDSDTSPIAQGAPRRPPRIGHNFVRPFNLNGPVLRPRHPFGWP